MKSVIMYLTAFLPMWVIMWIKEVIIIVDNILKHNEGYELNMLLNPLLISEFIFFIVLLVSYYLIKIKTERLTTFTAKVESVNNISAEYYLSYFSLFVLTLIEFSLIDCIDLFVMILIVIMLGFVYIKNGLFYMNPIINITNCYIYEIEYTSDNNKITKTIISKEKLYNGDNIEFFVSNFDFTFLKRKF